MSHTDGEVAVGAKPSLCAHAWAAVLSFVEHLRSLRPLQVDAEGNILTTSAEENSDLLAALCGAGNGNYGARLAACARVVRGVQGGCVGLLPLANAGRALSQRCSRSLDLITPAWPQVRRVSLLCSQPICLPRSVTLLIRNDAGIVTDFTIKLWDLPPGNLTIAKFNAGAVRYCSNSVLQTLLLGPCRTVDRGFLRCLLCQPHAAPDQHHRQPAKLLYFCPLQTCCLPILPALRAAKKDVKGQLAFLRWFQDSWTQSADPRMGVAVSVVCGLLSLPLVTHLPPC